MSSFKYKGRDKSGQVVEGLIDAPSQNSVVLKLASVDIVPVSILPTTNEIIVEDYLVKYMGFNKPKIDDLIICMQQLHTLIKAGVSLMRSLKVVSATVKHSGLRNSLLDVVLGLESGLTLSKALEKHQHIFSPLIISMVEVGENTGHLEVSFLQIKKYLESELHTRRRIRSALRYPLMVIFAIVIALGIINIVVIPAFGNFFKAFGSKLPLPTQILIACSDFIMNYWWLLGILGLLFAIGAVAFLHTLNGKWWLSYIKLKIPFIGSIVQRSIYARFCRAFSMTFSANVPLLHAFKVVAKVVESPCVSQKIMQMRHNVEKGESLYVAAQNSNMFSPLVLQMLAVAEETGEIDTILLDIADYYEKDVDYDLKKLGDAIEPLLIIIIAMMVLVLALGVFLPMWDLSSVALKKMEGI